MSNVLEEEKEAGQEVIDSLRADQAVSVVSFARTAKVLYPLGTNKNDARAAIRNLEISSQTNIEAGLDVAVAQLLDSTSDAHNGCALGTIVIFSDGRQTRGNALDAADRARQHHIRVLAIEYKNRANADLLQKLVTDPQTDYYRPTEAELESLITRLTTSASGQK